MIAVVDYGMGNLRSVQKALEYLGLRCVVTSKKSDIDSATHIILPGVGAFRDAMRNLNELDLAVPLKKNIEDGKPFLGICLGMQILFEESLEFGRHRGLGVLSGKVVKLFQSPEGMTSSLKVPHMGWNRVNVTMPNPLIDLKNTGGYYYFVHSYYAVPGKNDLIAGTTEYGIRFASFVRKDNIFATQFHPEKSHTDGLEILRRFGEMKC